MTNDAPTPPPLGYAPRRSWGVAPPRALAYATIGLTAVAVILQFVFAVGAHDMIAHYSDMGKTDYQMDTGTVVMSMLSSLGSTAMLAAYITLALWMTRIHRRLVDAGDPPRWKPAWSWVSWIIPGANAVLPYLVVRDLNRRARSWAVLPWWILFVSFNVVTGVAAVRDIAAMDLGSIGSDPTNALAGMDLPHTADALVPTAYILAAAWVFLAIMLTQMTAKDTAERPGANI